MTWHFLLVWFGLVWSCGWLFLPVSLRIFGTTLPDGGLAVGRVVSLAMWTLGAFWAGSFGVSTQNSALVGLAFALLGCYTAVRRKGELRIELRARRRAIWASETVFVLVFLAFFALRGFWSDTSGTNGEKSMDSALIGSIRRAQHLPPPNPYAAGAEVRSYYYFGHLQTALLSCATGLPVRWTYNLMSATLPALCFSTLFSLGAGLTARLRGGALVSLGVLGLGTLQPLQQWFQFDKPGADKPFHLDFFATSRVIPYSINEFPFFTFNQADLHAHYFGLPLALATICLAYTLFRGHKAALWPAMAILGAQILTNTWDFPAYALLLALGVSLGQAGTEGRGKSPGATRKVASIALIWGGALLLASPYLLGIKTAASPPRVLEFPASPLREWGLLWGIFAVVWLTFLAYAWDEAPRLRWFCGAFAGLFLLYGCAVPWGKPDPFVLPLIVFLLLFSSYGALKLRAEARFVCCLAICGLLALVWSETTWAGFLGDPNHPGFDDFKRQDTVFKFGLQTWVLWGIAASCGVFYSFKKWPRLLQCAVMPLLGTMALASLAVVSGRARNFERFDGWDAWAHLMPSERAAASWLLNHAKPGENLLEAEQWEGGDYTPYARYASATGIPTIIGPQAHTFQWSPANSGDARQEWAEVARRKALGRALYTEMSGENRREALQTLGVRFIVFGELERDQYGPLALQRLRADHDLAPVAHFAAPQSASGFSTPREVWIFRSS